MAFAQDHGTFCLAFPLKLGVGVSGCLVFLHGILGALALTANDVRFQPNGYDLRVDKLPSVVNAFGILIGFIGTMGTYDDKINWLWLFNRYCAIRIVVMLATAIADLVALQKCDEWMALPHPVPHPRMEALSEIGVCPWARWSFVVGASVELGFWCYVLLRCYIYEVHMRTNPPYKIDFGIEKDIDAKWSLYKVNASSRVPKASEEEAPKFYGSTAVTGQGYGDVITTRPPLAQEPLQRAAAQGEVC